jgi:hypothetical protein
MRHKKEKVLIGAILLLIFWFGIGQAGDTETCGYCNEDKDCADNGWCAPFNDGKNHCVPSYVGPADPYSCSESQVAHAGAYGAGGGG